MWMLLYIIRFFRGARLADHLRWEHDTIVGGLSSWDWLAGSVLSIVCYLLDC